MPYFDFSKTLLDLISATVANYEINVTEDR